MPLKLAVTDVKENTLTHAITSESSTIFLWSKKDVMPPLIGS